MPHLSDETLALLALGEDVSTPRERAHLAGCPACTASLAELRQTAALGRSALSIGELSPPDPRVWDAIERDLGLAPQVDDRPLATVTPITAGIAAAPVARPRTPASRPRTRRRTVVIAAAAAAAVLVAGLVGVRLLAPSTPRVVAAATLAGLPAWPGASGQATVERGAKGLVLDLQVDAPPTPARFREVWLITADQKTLISLGTLHGTTGEFSVPKGIDLARYDIVDVSSEPRDGNPHHSGDSIVRGALRTGA